MKISIRCRNVRLSEAERGRVVRHAEFALSPFRQRVRQVAFVAEDENARRGGVDKFCRVKVRVAPLGDVVTEARGETLDAAAGKAVDRAARLVARNLKRLSDRKKGRTSMAGETVER